LNLYQYRDHNR